MDQGVHWVQVWVTAWAPLKQPRVLGNHLVLAGPCYYPLSTQGGMWFGFPETLILLDNKHSSISSSLQCGHNPQGCNTPQTAHFDAADSEGLVTQLRNLVAFKGSPRPCSCHGQHSSSCPPVQQEQRGQTHFWRAAALKHIPC